MLVAGLCVFVMVMFMRHHDRFLKEEKEKPKKAAAARRQKEAEVQRQNEQDRKRKSESARDLEQKKTAASKKASQDKAAASEASAQYAERKIQLLCRNKKLNILKESLPFNLSVIDLEGSAGKSDEKAWSNVISTIDFDDKKSKNLYLVKVRSLITGQSFYKVGITSQDVEQSFKKSTQVELDEVLALRRDESWLLIFIEYHLAREFRLTLDMCNVLGVEPAVLQQLGSDGVVMPSASEKIAMFIGELGPLHSQAKTELKEFELEMVKNYQLMYDRFYFNS
jgi:flagellar biosynthesis GTPase FlhF